MSTPESTADTRDALRRRLLQQRQQLPDRAGLDAALEQALEQALALQQPACIGAYCAIRGEFDPLPLLTRLRAQQPELTLALPRTDPAQRTMGFARWSPEQALVPGGHGILEPGADAPAVEPDLLLIPCVGFVPVGLRLGYGGGYYDRYLAGHGEIYTIGLAYEAGRIEALQAQPHDQLLDLILTESAAYGLDAELLGAPD